MLDERLTFDAEITTKKALFRHLNCSRWILSSHQLSGASTYHVWMALFRSRFWYQAGLLAHISSAVSNMLLSFLYQGVKTLLRIRGKPSKLKLFDICFGRSPDKVIGKVFTRF